MSEIALFRTHIWNYTARSHFAQLKLQSDKAGIIYDATNREPLGGAFNFTAFDYTHCPYPKPTDMQIAILPTYQIAKKKGLEHSINWNIYFNPEYAVLMYYLAHPEYEYYWSIEYDVFMNGDWRVLFDECKKDDSDILACYIDLFKKYPPFSLIYHLTNFDVPDKHKLSIYGPIVRYSNKALQIIHDGLISGKQGFYEIIDPILCSMAGLKITDIGEIGKKADKIFYYPKTFCGEQLEILTKETYDKFPNVLFHPVKEKYEHA